MSVSTCTFAVLLYGFKIREPQTDECDSVTTHITRVLHGNALSQAGVRHAYAGRWEEPDLFLCTAMHSVALYVDSPMSLALGDDADTCARWDGLLNAAARALGVPDHEPANWLLLVHEV